MTVHNPAQNSSDNLELPVILHNIIAAQTWNKKHVTVARDSYIPESCLMMMTMMML